MIAALAIAFGGGLVLGALGGAIALAILLVPVRL